MKTQHFLLTIGMILICTVAFAQTLRVGAAGNIGTTNWSKDFEDSATRIVAGIGGSALYSITDKLNVGAELMYSSIGPKIDDPYDGFYGRISIPVIQVPLFASYEVIDKLQVHAGLQPAMVLSVNAYIDNEPHEGKYDLSDDYGSFNMDLILGASYDITENVTGMFRFNQGLVDLDTELERRKFQTVGVQLGVRYWLFKQ